MACISVLSRSVFTAAVILGILFGGWTSLQAQSSASTDARSKELRLAVVMSNSALAVRNPDGQVSGLAVELGKALAAKGPVDLKLVLYDNIVRFNQSLGKDEWDVAFVP